MTEELYRYTVIDDRTWRKSTFDRPTTLGLNTFVTFSLRHRGRSNAHVYILGVYP